MSIRIPILMYHGIADGPGSPPVGWSRHHTIAWSDFTAQIALLRSEGWSTLLPQELVTRCNQPSANPALAITFDDGHASDRRAAGLLAEAGLRATFYITWSHLGQQGYLTKSDVVGLAGNGFGVGAHGLTHMAFTALDDQRLARELAVSKSRIEDMIGADIGDLACPFGAYDRRVLDAAFKAGYRTVMTSDIGRPRVGGNRVFARLPVFDDTRLKDFAALLHEGPLALARRRIVQAIARRSANWSIFGGRREEQSRRSGVLDWR